MVSKWIYGKEIILGAQNTPNKCIFENRKKPSYAEVLDQIMLKYFANKYFYYDAGWHMSTKRKFKKGEKLVQIKKTPNGREIELELYKGLDIIKNKGGRKSNMNMIDKRKTQKTWRQAYEEILHDVVYTKKFYHRGNGDWCEYNEERDKAHIKNVQWVSRTDPITGEANKIIGVGKKGQRKDKVMYQGFVRYDPSTKTGYRARGTEHMGDGNPNVIIKKSGKKGRK